MSSNWIQQVHVMNITLHVPKFMSTIVSLNLSKIQSILDMSDIA
jgi:hypothetical protein